MRVVTIGFGPHRVEMLDLMKKHIRQHRVVVLEEPSHPDFRRMLKKEASIRRYLASGAFGFPRFTLRAYRLYQGLFETLGISFFQVDPYTAIAKRLMEGEQPGSDLEYAVWKSEHRAANALLHYYEAAAAGNFEAMVQTTKAFAQADASRTLFREKLRSKEIASVLETTEGDVYIEAGYIHLSLYPLLKEKLPPSTRPRILFLLREPISNLSNLPWRQHLSPGDILTLRFLFGRPERPGDDLLAAQSLVYVSLLSKEEKLPSPFNPYPHLTEELYLCRWVRQLTYQDCTKLYKSLSR